MSDEVDTTRTLRKKAWTLVLVTAAICLVLLSSCGVEAPRPEGPPPDSLGAGLESTGGTLVEWGLIVGGLALVACFLPVLSPFSKFSSVIAEFGFGAALVGGVYLFITEHPWMVLLACVATAVAWGVYRRDLILRWYDRARRVLPLNKKD